MGTMKRHPYLAIYAVSVAWMAVWAAVRVGSPYPAVAGTLIGALIPWGAGSLVYRAGKDLSTGLAAASFFGLMAVIGGGHYLQG